MPNYNNIKATIAANVYPNGQGKVTAPMVRTAMYTIVDALEQVDNNLSGKFYGFAPTSADLPAGDDVGYAYVGSSAPFAVWNFDGTSWSDSGVTHTPAEGNGEDIDTDAQGKLQFANRPNTDGMGYVILRADASFASQVGDSDTIYEIRYDFDLGGASVTIPVGCVLKFVGGSLSNGTIVGQDTSISVIGTYTAFNGAILSGTWRGYATDLYFNGRDVDILSNALAFEIVELKKPEYWLEEWKSIALNANGSSVNGNGVKIYCPADKGAKHSTSWGNQYDINYLFGAFSTTGGYIISGISIFDNGDDLPSGFGEDMSVFTIYNYIYFGALFLSLNKVNCDGIGQGVKQYNWDKVVPYISMSDCSFKSGGFCIELYNGDYDGNIGITKKMNFVGCSFTSYPVLTFVGQTSIVGVNSPDEILFERCYFEGLGRSTNCEFQVTTNYVKFSLCKFVNAFIGKNNGAIPDTPVFKYLVDKCDFKLSAGGNNEYSAVADNIEIRDSIFDLSEEPVFIQLGKESRKVLGRIALINNTFICNSAISRTLFVPRPADGCVVDIVGNKMLFNKLPAGATGAIRFDVPQILSSYQDDSLHIRNNVLPSTSGKMVSPSGLHIVNNEISSYGISVDSDGFSTTGDAVIINKACGRAFTLKFFGKVGSSGSAGNDSFIDVPLDENNTIAMRTYYAGNLQLYLVNGAEKTILIPYEHFRRIMTNANWDSFWPHDYQDFEVVVSNYYDANKLRIILRSRGVDAYLADYDYSGGWDVTGCTITPTNMFHFKSFGLTDGGVIGPKL